MIELGKVQELEIVRKKEFGVYLAQDREDEASVLLPKKQVPEGAEIGDKVEVFIYRDSSDRLIATTARPLLQVGETARSEHFWIWVWKRIFFCLLKSRLIL